MNAKTEQQARREAAEILMRNQARKMSNEPSNEPERELSTDEPAGDILVLIDQLRDMAQKAEWRDEIHICEAIGHLYQAFAALGKVSF